VQARADRARGKEGERHQRRARERRREPRRKQPGRDREGEMVEPDHRMGEAGEKALRQRPRRRSAHDVMGLGAGAGRGENQKRKREAGEHFGDLPIRDRRRAAISPAHTKISYRSLTLSGSYRNRRFPGPRRRSAKRRRSLTPM